jgi:hypothetical protein
MPTNSEHNPSSAITSQSRSVHREGRPVIEAFDDDELLYRRFLKAHFVGNELTPQYFKFPKPSFNRSKFSRPEDVLHIDCCEGNHLPVGWGVLEGKASELRVSALSDDKVTFALHPRHAPLEACYAHSELWCTCPPDIKDVKPSPTARERLRIALSRVLKIRIEATI